MEPSLQSAWVADDTQLIASMSYMIVKYGSKVSSLDTEMKETVQASLAKLLRSMKSIVSSRCDIGITNAATSTDLKYKEEEETMIGFGICMFLLFFLITAILVDTVLRSWGYYDR